MQFTDLAYVKNSWKLVFGPLPLYADGIIMALVCVSVPIIIATGSRILMKLSMDIMPLEATSTFQAYI
jgi:hypothetical protein